MPNDRENRIRPLTLLEVRQFDRATLLYVYTQNEQLLIAEEVIKSAIMFESTRINHDDLANGKRIYAAGRLAIEGGQIARIDDWTDINLKETLSWLAVERLFERFGFTEAPGKYQFKQGMVDKKLDTIIKSSIITNPVGGNNPTLNQRLTILKQHQTSSVIKPSSKISTDHKLFILTTAQQSTSTVTVKASAIPSANKTLLTACVSKPGLTVKGLNQNASYTPGFFSFTPAPVTSTDTNNQQDQSQRNGQDSSHYSGGSGGGGCSNRGGSNIFNDNNSGGSSDRSWESCIRFPDSSDSSWKCSSKW